MTKRDQDAPAARFLIVDDHPVLRRLLSTLLTETFANALAAEAGTCAAAEELLAEGPWDLVLLDAALPDGCAVPRVLEHAAEVSPTSRIMLITGSTSEWLMLEALRYGASGVLVKTCDDGEIIHGVKAVLAGQKYLSPSVAARVATLAVSGQQQVTPYHGLSLRELQVLELLSKGKSVKETAALLEIGERTVSTYRARLMLKLGVRSSAELLALAFKYGLVL